MHILVFNQYFSTPKGSYGTRIYEFAKRWVRAGHEVTVVTAIYEMSDLQSSQLVSRMNIDGIDVRAINVKVSNHHGFALRVFTFLAYAAISSYFALTLRADVVVASSGPITVAIPALIAKYLRGKAFVFEVRDLWPEGAIQLGLLRNRQMIGLLRWFERLCYRSAKCVVGLSEGMAEWIREHYGFQNLAVVPNASDNELAAAVRPLDAVPPPLLGKSLVVYAGSVGYIHNCGQLLDLSEFLRKWGYEDIALVVIGDGKERAAIEGAARERNLANLHFLGRVPKETVMAWLQISCCSLSLVRDNPFFDACSPNKIFDAFAAGVPVIQDTQGWLKRLFEEHQCGITVARHNTEQMARAVVELTVNPPLRAKLAGNAKRVALEVLDRGLLANQMLEILARCAAQA